MMKVEISFENDLADLVRLRRGRPRITATVRDHEAMTVRVLIPAVTSLKDVVESLGVPHGEVGTVAGDLEALNDLVHDGCVVRLRPAAPFFLADPRFLCDGHLGRLARLLRQLGFDTAWNPAWSEAEIARRGINSGRTVLSRHRGLLKRKELTRAMLVKSDDPVAQARQVVSRFQLAGRAHLFGRCSVCNGRVEPVDKAAVSAQIPPRTTAWLDVYYQCAGCGKLYWEGTHVERITVLLHAILNNRTWEQPND